MRIAQNAPRKAMLRVLAGERVDPPPIWIMRQAGRYLPEYRELRARTPNFLDFCYAPALATEAVLQPLRRFPLDAAILFSDILVIPDALGRKVEFVEREGPRLQPLGDEPIWRFEEPEKAIQRLAPVYEAVERIKAAISSETTLIGFCGAPWTVATYMLQGRGGDKDWARRIAYERPDDVDSLLALLAEVSARHLAAQARAGAEVLQVFESWAEGLSEALFERLVIAPTTMLMAKLRALGVETPVIGFPRGCGGHLARYAAETGVDAVGLDTGVSGAFARTALSDGMPRQGNLDPQLLVSGGEALRRGVNETLAAFRDSPHVFNLGHGITPDADPNNVAALVEAVRADAQGS
jgi:uroporphyrinogen decarboxylase